MTKAVVIPRFIHTHMHKETTVKSQRPVHHGLKVRPPTFDLKSVILILLRRDFRSKNRFKTDYISGDCWQSSLVSKGTKCGYQLTPSVGWAFPVDSICFCRYGFIIAVTTIDNIGVGHIQPGRGFVVYPVKYKAGDMLPLEITLLASCYF